MRQRSHQGVLGKSTSFVAENPAKNKYSDEQILAIEKSLSPDRFNSYVIQAKGDRNKAILLYERNTELSEALFGVIQGVEITLRNSIHRTLQRDKGFDAWYDHIHLERSESEALRLAKDTVQRHYKPVTPPRVVAQLSFGFWVRLTAGVYEKTLWVPYLNAVFPSKMSRSFLNNRLLKIKELRNGIAHHERISKRDLQRDYEDILETIGWLSPIVSNWVRNTTRFEKIPKA